MEHLKFENISPDKNFFLGLGEIVFIWILADIGYYYVIPMFGFGISYNSSPIEISIYFALCTFLSTIYFRKILFKKFETDYRILLYIFLSLGSAFILWGIIYSFSTLINLQTYLNTTTISNYTDMLLATPWYFLPKAFEVLFQQVLITVLVLELSYRYDSLSQIKLVYLFLFVTIHFAQFIFTKTSPEYSIILTAGAFLSSFVFPKLILKVKGGFIYVYMIHFLFYIILSMILHIFPPPGYLFVVI